MRRIFLSALSFVACLLVGGGLMAQSERVLYTWAGTGNVQNWVKNFGTNDATFANGTADELAVTETGAAGSGIAISDNFNNSIEGKPGAGGIDLTGLSAIEIDVGHNGADVVMVQFFTQASADSNFVAFGADVAVAPGMNTYSLSLAGLTPVQIAFLRTIGLNIRDHIALGNLVWTIQEVRSVGAGLTARTLADHEPGSPNGGLQGAIVNFHGNSVLGNTAQDQSGLSHNTGATPPGNTGSLHWTDIGSGDGGAISYANGTVWSGGCNTFCERPTDLSNYKSVRVRVAATNLPGSALASVNLAYFMQTNNFAAFDAAPAQELPADGLFHELCFSIGGIATRDFVDQHGVDVAPHPGGDVNIDIDRLVFSASDCPVNYAPSMTPAGWVLLALGALAGGGFLLRRRPALA